MSKGNKKRLRQEVAEASSNGSNARPVLQVLLLGEANFSFALALRSMLEPPTLPTPPLPVPALITSSASSGADAEAAEARRVYRERLTSVADYFGMSPPDSPDLQLNITATCYESHVELEEKYPETVGILSRLWNFAVDIRYQVNAWDLTRTFGDGVLWDVIAWNHPHLGTEDFRLHQFLLAHFFASVAKHLRPKGRVVLTLLEGQEKRWELLKQASRHGFSLLCDPVQFAAASFPGYESKRNSTGRSFKNLHTQRVSSAPSRSWTYHLGMQGESKWSSLSRAPKSAKGQDAEPTSLKCDACGKTFSCAQGLKTHHRQVHELKKYGDWKPEAETKVNCQQCGRPFRDSEALRQHTVAAHSDDSGHASRARGARGPSLLPGQKAGGYSYRNCQICGMSLPLGMSMAAHLEALKPLVDLPYACVCGRSFVEQRAMEQHKRFCKEYQERRGTLLTFLGCWSRICCGCGV